MSKQDRVELRARGTFHSAVVGTKKRGDRFETTVAYAQHLYELHLVEPVNGPLETKPTGPAENKETPAKKLSGAPTDGRSTGSQSSSAPGKAFLSSSSEAVRALRTETDSIVSRALASISRAINSRYSR